MVLLGRPGRNCTGRLSCAAREGTAHKNPKRMGMVKGIAMAAGLLLLGFVPRQAWTESSLTTFVAGGSSRTWSLKARKGTGEFAELELGARLTFNKDGKLSIVQSGQAAKAWTWSVLADPQAPIGFKIRLNGGPFQIIPVRKVGSAADRLTLISQDEKSEVPAKIYITSPKPK